MAILLNGGSTYAALARISPTGAPALAQVTHNTTAQLPGDITLTLSATVEVCADDTFGPASRITWELSDRPTVMHGLRDGEFFEAFEAAIGDAWIEAAARARHECLALARQSTLESRPAPSGPSPLPA